MFKASLTQEDSESHPITFQVVALTKGVVYGTFYVWVHNPSPAMRSLLNFVSVSSGPSKSSLGCELGAHILPELHDVVISAWSLSYDNYRWLANLCARTAHQRSPDLVAF